MKTDCKIVGKKVILIEYRECHVVKYNRWMKSPSLLILTASVPLSLEGEYEMQKTWSQDPKKCTFIILHNISKATSSGRGIDDW